MQKFDVVIGLERLAEARKRWNEGRRDFDAGYEKVLLLLVHEGARAFMSDREMATVLGWTTGRMRAFMRKVGLSPAAGKRVLREEASKALRENAELMGIRPHEVDLSSPLAYLPMGNDLRKQLQDQQVSRVTAESEKVCVCEEPVPTGRLPFGEVCVACSYVIKFPETITVTMPRDIWDNHLEEFKSFGISVIES